MLCSAPTGITSVVDPNAMGAGVVHTLGPDLPSVNPNTYPGTVHFGPSTTIVGHGVGQVLPSGTIVSDPSLNANAGVNFNAGF